MTSPAVVPENPPSTASGLGLLRVLDATDGVAGQFCGRLFADHGADVILLGTLEGTRTRGEDGLSWHLNCGKRAVAGDPVTFGGDDLDALLHGLDVVIVNQNTAPFGWDLATHPRLVVCCMSDFGAIGPYASWQGSEFVHQAYSGLAYSTGRVDAEPLYGFGHRAYYCAGLAAYGATLAALVERECSGTGQKVGVSVAETAAAMSQNLVTIYSYSQTVPRRGAYEGALGCHWCADGWIVVFVGTGRWPAVCEAFGLTKSQAAVRELVSGSEVLICNLAPGALVVLNAQPGIGGTELARRLGLSQPGGTRLAEVLEQRGLVERRPGADGRAVSVRLTAAGRRSAATVLAARQKLMAEFLSDVDQADRMALDRVLAGVLERLTGSAASPYYLCRFCDEAACTRDRRDCPVELAWQEREQPASDRREGSRWSR